jgi:hypothetical protein
MRGSGMKRVWDYFGFAVWFLGLGTMAFWLIGSPEHQMMSPALQAIGLLAAVLVAVRLALIAFRRWRSHAASAALASPQVGRAMQALKPPRPAPVPPSLPTVKPRRQFGLRNMPR